MFTHTYSQTVITLHSYYLLSSVFKHYIFTYTYYLCPTFWVLHIYIAIQPQHRPSSTLSFQTKEVYFTFFVTVKALLVTQSFATTGPTTKASPLAVTLQPVFMNRWHHFKTSRFFQLCRLISTNLNFWLTLIDLIYHAYRKWDFENL